MVEMSNGAFTQKAIDTFHIFFSRSKFFQSGDQMDAAAHRAVRAARLSGLEGNLRREGSALLLAAQRLSPDDQGTARRDPASLHLHGVSQQLPVATRPDRRRFLREEVISASASEETPWRRTAARSDLPDRSFPLPIMRRDDE